MARVLAATMLCLWVAAAGLVVPKSAGADPVVVELFTSQGCSACPPADALLAELALRDDVIALALHVDYWDYIGWKDVFGRAAFTKRQRAYAKVAERSMIYTPQMIVAGAIEIAGAHPDKAEKAIAKAASVPPRAAIALTRDGSRLLVALEAREKIDGTARVILVRYHQPARVEVTRGENAGRTMSHVNVVAAWDEIARWNGADPLRVEAEYPGANDGVVLVQADGPGAILAAARVP